MPITVVLFFVIGSLIEMSSLIWISTVIGSLNTISLIMFSFLIGVVVSRAYGRDWFEKIQWHLKSGTLPEDEVVDGSVMAFASILLRTPGLISDAIGFIIIIPFLRSPFKDMTVGMMKKKIAKGEPWFFFNPQQ
ncbi:MAG: FxsA family protein [Nitrospinales bacterium]